GAAIGSAIRLAAPRHERQRSKARHGDVAGIGVRAEGAVAVLVLLEKGQPCLDGPIRLRRNHALGGRAVWNRPFTAVAAAAVVGGQGETRTGRGGEAHSAAREKLTARPHGSVSLTSSLFRDRAVVAFDKLVVFRHELF